LRLEPPAGKALLILEGGEAMKREYLSHWPKVNLYVPPAIRERLEEEARHRALSISDVVREALAARYKETAS
jgi:hypothetical protein